MKTLKSYRTSTCDLGTIEWASPDGTSTYGRIFNGAKGIATMRITEVGDGVYDIAVADRTTGEETASFNNFHGTLDKAIMTCELLAQLNAGDKNDN